MSESDDKKKAEQRRERLSSKRGMTPIDLSTIKEDLDQLQVTSADPNIEPGQQVLLAQTSDGRILTFRLEEPTPPPVNVRDDETLSQVWSHVDRSKQRTADQLSEIAHSSGVGMTIRPEMDAVRKHTDDVDQKLAETVVYFQKKLRTVRWIVGAILVPTATAVIYVATRLYSSGYAQGTADAWKSSVELRLQILENRRQVWQETRASPH